MTGFIGAIEKDENGEITRILTPDGWVKAKIAPVKKWSTLSSEKEQQP